MSASSSILGGKRKIRRCKRKPAGVNDISRLLLWSGKTKSPAYFHTLSIFGGRGWITQAAHLKRPRRGLFAAGTYSGGPYELRLPIFLQPLGGALKNRSAVPASPPCFRRRRTGCGTQHPLRLACVSLAAAPTTPRCFRRWRRSSSLQSAPLLFESTLAALYKLPDKTETPVLLQHRSSWWARVDVASRAAKNSPLGCFCAVFGDSAAAVRIHPPYEFSLVTKQKPQRTCIR